MSMDLVPTGKPLFDTGSHWERRWNSRITLFFFFFFFFPRRALTPALALPDVSPFEIGQIDHIASQINHHKQWNP